MGSEQTTVHSSTQPNKELKFLRKQYIHYINILKMCEEYRVRLINKPNILSISKFHENS